MKVFRLPETVSLSSRPVVTVGNFDGVHPGHRAIFSAMKRISEDTGAPSLVLSFSVHPRAVLYPEHPLPVITTVEERLSAIGSCGIDAVVLMDFTLQTAAMTAASFVERYIVEAFHARHVVIGYDHAFGKNREGNIDYLVSLGARCDFGVTQVPPFLCDGHPVSSSRIRAEIEDGDVEDVSRYLGRRYSLSGAVVEGLRRGRTIGFPTANITPEDPNKVIPSDGVYATRIRTADGVLRHSVTNVGSNPTFGDVPRTIETHIFDFDGDIYGTSVTLEFVTKLRDEAPFASVDALVAAIRRDADDARRILTSL